MTKNALLLLGAAIAMGLPAPAQAESPQHIAIEARFTPYMPDLDSSPGLTRPVYSDLLNAPDAERGRKPVWGLLGGAEIDYQFLHRFGVLGVGLASGYFRKSAPQLLYFSTPQGSKTCTISDAPRTVDGKQYTFKDYTLPAGVDPTGKVLPDACFSSDENILNVVPLELMLVYRFDVLSKRFRVPLIPYMKAGLAYYFWWFGSSSEFVVKESVDANGNAVDNGDSGSGGTFGFVLRPGLGIDLGAIDRAAAHVMDKEIGLNRVTAFAELNYARIDNFGNPGNKDVGGKQVPTTKNFSDLSFTAGLAFEF